MGSRSRRRAPVLALLLLLVGGLSFPVARAVLKRPRPPPVGTLLVATERIDDPNFERTVVVITRVEPGRVVGVVLNRPPTEEHEPHFGGPVLPELTSYFVRSSTARGRQVLPEVVWRRFDRMEREIPERRFSGLSVWSPAQLDRELRRGDWRSRPATAEVIFDGASDRLWERLHAAGG